MNNKDRINAYLKRVGLRQWPSLKSFEKYLRKVSPKAGPWIQFMESLSPSDMNWDVYFELKNADLQLTLGVTGQLFRDIYEDYLNWWFGQDFEYPERLLDIGCEFGVLTCFYATIYPDSEILGIDKCALAIDRAHELADQLGLKNVRFEVLDINNLSTLKPEHRYDLITSTIVLNEVVSLPDDRYWNLEELDLDKGMEPCWPIFTGIRRLLKDSGFYISLDNHIYASSMARWMRALNRANMKIDWNRSQSLPWSDKKGNSENFIVTVSQPDKSPAQDIIQALSFLSISEFADKAGPSVLNGPAAEILFRSFKDKKPIFGVEYDFSDGSGSMRREIWQASQVAIQYVYTNTGDREIRFFPALGIPVLKAMAIGMAKTKCGDRTFKLSVEAGPYEAVDIQEASDGTLTIVTESTVESPLVLPGFVMKRIS
jgi:hypothetical protein